MSDPILSCFLIGNESDIDELNPDMVGNILKEINESSCEEIKTNRSPIADLLGDIQKVIEIISKHGVVINLNDLIDQFKNETDGTVRLSGALFHLKIAGLLVDNKGVLSKTFFGKFKQSKNCIDKLMRFARMNQS